MQYFWLTRRIAAWVARHGGGDRDEPAIEGAINFWDVAVVTGWGEPRRR
jgi:hypothetical protein